MVGLCKKNLFWMISSTKQVHIEILSTISIAFGEKNANNIVVEGYYRACSGSGYHTTNMSDENSISIWVNITTYK